MFLFHLLNESMGDYFLIKKSFGSILNVIHLADI